MVTNIHVTSSAATAAERRALPGQLFIPIAASVEPALIHMPPSTIRNGPCRDRAIRGS